MKNKKSPKVRVGINAVGVRASENRELISDLKGRGKRLTKARKAILTIFERAKSPLSAIEIERILKTDFDIAVNKTTVYRELEMLLEEKIIGELDLLDGKKRYELRSEHENHHHHLVCTKCQRVQCIDECAGLGQLEQKIADQFGFKVTQHFLEFFGLCARCG